MDRSYSHSRARAKSASVLPSHPELDITRRRSGIRHFSHVPSVKYSQKPRGGRSVTSPMRWKNWLLGGVAELYFPKRRAEEGKKRMGVVGNVSDPRMAMQGLPPLPGQALGCVLTPMKQQQRRGPIYPYPLHVPRAAAPVQQQQQQRQQQQQPYQQTVYVQQPAAANPAATPMDKIMSIASGIGCTIALLFMWIFRYEVLKFGVLFGVLGILWMAGRWYGQVSVLQREQELVRNGRLYAGQVQQQPPQPQPQPQPYAQLVERLQQQPQAVYLQQQQQQPQQQQSAAYGQQQQPQQQRYVIAHGPFPARPIPGGL